MALIRSGLTTTEWQNYQLGDYETQKKAFLLGIAEEAEQILKTARQKAGDILKEAHAKGLHQADAEVQRKREEGFHKGHEEGLLKGKEEALELEKERIESELVPLMQHLNTVMVEYKIKAQDLLDGAEDTLVKASMDLAEQVIGIESTFNVDVLKARLTKALQYLRPGLELRIRLPIGAREKLEPLMSQLQDEENLESVVVWSEDPALESGSIIVSSGDSAVQFHSDMQWKALLEKLKVKERD